MAKLVFTLLIFFLAFAAASAQVRVYSLLSQAERVEQLWDMELNTNAKNQRIVIEVVLTKPLATPQKGGVGEELYRAKSPVVGVGTGFMGIHFSDIQPIEVLVNILHQDTVDQKLNYAVYLHNALTNQVIGTMKKELVFKRLVENKNKVTGAAILTKEKVLKAKPLGVSGEVVVQQFPVLEGIGNYNQQVLRGNLRVQQRLFNVPIEADLGYSNEAVGLGQPGFKLGFNIDQAALKRELMRQTIKKLQVMKYHPDSLKQMVLEKAYPAYNKLKKKLGDVNYDSIRRQMDNLSDYKQIARSAAFKKGNEELNALKKEYKVDSIQSLLTRTDLTTEVKNKIQNLEGLKAGEAQIQEKIKSLEQELKPYQKYRKLYDKMREFEHTDLQSLLSEGTVLNKMNELTAGKSSKWMGIIASIKDFRVGTAYPLFSQQTLGGARVDGLDVSWLSTKNMYVRAVVGQFRGEYIGFRDSSHLADIIPVYMAAVKVGIGNVRDNHLHLSYMSFRKQGKLNEVNDGMRAYQNDVVGADILVGTHDRKLILGAEANLSLYNPDKNYAAVEGGEQTWEDHLLLLKKRDGFKSDWAFKGNLQWRISGEKTKLSGYFDKVGEGYKSVGAPFLLSNVLRYELRLHQSLWKDKLMLEGYYRKDFDNFSALSRDSSYYAVISDYGINLLFNAPKAPSFAVIVAPYTQTGVGDSLHQNQTRGLMYQLSTNYDWSVKDFRMGSQLGLVYQQLEGSNYGGLTKQLTATGSQNIGFRQVSLNTGFNYSPAQFLNGELKGESWVVDVSGGVVVKNMPLRVGYQYFNLFGERSRQGYYANLSVAVAKGIGLSLMVQRNAYYYLSQSKSDWTGFLKLSFVR
jgi:hypothetical protein